MFKRYFAVFASALVLASGSVLAYNHGHSNKESKNIVEVAQEAGQFNTLIAAVQAAGLVDTLATGGPFTVFAPTDEAFAQIPQEQLAALLEDTETLTAILTYHVVSGKVRAEDVVGLDSATTVQGSDISISVSDEGVHINGARVLTTDIEASNGIIHVIDAVITP